MAWYYGTFSCECEGRVNITGPTKHREWKKERAFEKMCETCYEKYLQEQRESANKEAAEKSKEMELPKLIGTEKQVIWANTLRQKLIDIVENKIETFSERKGGNLDLINEIFQFILENKINSNWFIDNRFNFEDIENLFKEVKKEMDTLRLKTDTDIDEKLKLEVKAESTVMPEKQITKAAVEINISNNTIEALFEKNDTFISIVKDLGYKWNGVWEKTIRFKNGTIEDRTAELGNKLLNAGFPIIILDKEIRRKAVEGDYKQECKRWVTKHTSGKYENWFYISFEYGDSMYNKAKSLPGSRYDRPGVVVRVEHYKEVEDFSNMYGFKFSRSALNLIKEYKAIKFKTVSPVKVENERPKDGLQEILQSSTNILNDLMDD